MGETKLREGYTTGACATAATKAALTALITGIPQTETTIYLPVGRWVTFAVERCEIVDNRATAAVIKDGGDDPDATHGAEIVSTVSWIEDHRIELDGGEGVGRVTKPGLPVSVGEAAINPVPRKMIIEAARDVLQQYGRVGGIRIVISVPKGEEIAKKNVKCPTWHYRWHFYFRNARHRCPFFNICLSSKYCSGDSSSQSDGLSSCRHNDRRKKRKVCDEAISSSARGSVY